MKNENTFEQQREKLLARLEEFYNNPKLTVSSSRNSPHGKKNRLHAHGFYEIFIMRDAHIRINPLGELHYNISPQEHSKLSITFSLNQNQFDWVVIPYGFCYYIDRELPPKLNGTLSFIQAIPDLLGKNPSAELAHDIAKLLIKILIELSSDIRRSHYEKTKVALKAYSLINKSFNDHNLSAQSIAKACGYSLQGLNAAFQKEFNCSIRQYIINLRLSDAAYKLIHSVDFDVMTIAYATGWNNRAYFSNSFRKAYGLPPHAYRKKVLSGELPMPIPPAPLNNHEPKTQK